MNKYKKMVGNSFIFALGNLGSKIMQFVMIPVYSYFLTTSQFGKVDVITTVIFLLSPVVCLDMFDAVFRFALDESEKKDVILSAGFFFITFTSIIIIIISLLATLLFQNEMVNIITFCLLLLSTIYYSLFSNFARSIQLVKLFAEAGILSTFVLVSMNILLLVFLG